MSLLYEVPEDKKLRVILDTVRCHGDAGAGLYGRRRKAFRAGSSGIVPAVDVVLEPNCGSFVYREALIFEEDTSYRFEVGRPKIRVYTSINSGFILEDFMAKLELVYG